MSTTNEPRQPSPQPLPRSTRRAEVFAWAMYDWANSAYSTLLITFLSAYVLQQVFPKKVWGNTGGTVFAWGIGASMLIAGVLSPVMGAMADAKANKRLWLGATALFGAAGSLAMAAVGAASPWLFTALFILVSFFFELSLGFYNSFLPEIADESEMDRVSGWGFALGYVGGGTALALAWALFQFGSTLGLESVDSRLRAGLVLMGVWWGVFSMPAIIVLRDRDRPRESTLIWTATARVAVAEVLRTLRNVRAFPTLAWFLLAFLLFNDGVQTVISQAPTFAQIDLHFTYSELFGVVLMIQFCAFPGAIVVSRLAERFGQKAALTGCLLVWMGLLGSAWFIDGKWQFWLLGVVVATVMGGTQSVSRAMMGVMTPPNRSAEFFGFFNLSGKATSFMGTFLFGLIYGLSGSARLAILSLLVEFILGAVLVARVNMARGRAEALA